jgi:TatD DNase family protein
VIVDSHCHLAGEEFEADLEAVARRAEDAGVGKVLCILADGDAAEEARAARVRTVWPAARFAVGIHPHNAKQHAGAVAAGVAAVEARVREWAAAAIGEIGLDYHYDFSPRDVQEEVFRAQIALARRLSLPVIIHTREATEETFRILREERAEHGVFHCFTGDAAMARAALDLGFHLSFAGIVTFPRAEALREAARLVPPDRLLVETDAPYLAPVPYRGKRNEPAFVAQVVDRLAEVRGVPPADLASATTANFHAVFG